MNKFFTKIAGLSLGLAMAIGVGVAVGSNAKEFARADAAISGTVGDKVTSSNFASGKSVVMSGKTGQYVNGISSNWITTTSTEANWLELTTEGNTSECYIKNGSNYLYMSAYNRATWHATSKSSFTVNSDGTLTYNAANTRFLKYSGDSGIRAYTANQSNTGYAYLYFVDTLAQTTISFNQNSGSGGQSSSVTATKGSAMPTISAVPSRTGYTFDGYYDAQSGGTKYYNADKSSAKNWDKDDATYTLYAHWTANQYDINYYDQGGSPFSGEHESGYPTKHTYGTATTLKSATKGGNNFDGWFTTSACTGSAVTSLGATSYTAAISLYAKWTATGTTYSISTTVTNGSYSGDTTITDNGGVASVTIAPTGDYKLPASISVSGADHTYNDSTGVISLSNATGNVTISAAMVALTEYSITVNETNGSHTGASVIKESRTATLTFTHDSGYGHPADVTVSGATKNWVRETGVLTLSNPTGNVTVTYAAVGNELESISISTNSGSYTLGDNFVMPTVTAKYTVNADAEVTSSASYSGYDPYTTGNQNVTISYTEGGITKTQSYTANVSAKSVGHSYNKISSVSDIDEGDYILAYSTYAFDGRDANNGYTTVTITSDSISGTAAMDKLALHITPVTGGYTLQVSSTSDNNPGKYLGFTSGSNSISFNANAVTIASQTVSSSTHYTYASGGAFTFGDSSTVLSWNNNSSNLRYRFYKTSTTSDSTNGKNYYAFDLYKKVESGAASLIRIVCDPAIDPATGYKGGDKFVGDPVYTTDFVVKKQLDTGNELTAITGFTINGGSEVVLTDTSNTITVSYTEGGIPKSTEVVVAATERAAELESVQLVEKGEVKKSGYIDFASATWNLDNIYVHYYWSDDEFDTEVTLASLVATDDATISPIKPTVGVTSFTVSYEYLEVEITNNTITLTEAVRSDYVKSISWSGTSASQFKAFSGGQLTAAQVGEWSVVPTLAGAGVQSALSFSDYVLKVGTKTISSLPYTWVSEDDGQELSITYGKDVDGNDFVKKNATAVANVCATINVIDHEETHEGTLEKSASWTTEQSSALSDQDFGTRDLDANISMTGVKSSGSTNVRIYSGTLRTYANNEMYFTPSNGAIIKTINLANISATECSDSEATHSGNVWTIKNGTETITFTGLNKVTVNADIVVEYQINGSETTTVHYANDMNHFDAQKTVVAFAKFMNTTMNGTNVCSGTFANLESAWDDVADKYDELFGASTTLNETELAWAKNMLKYATAAWGSDAENACVEKAMKTYEFCIAKHGVDPFMFESDGTTPLRSISSTPSISMLVSKNSSAVITIVIISAVSLAAIGGYFLFRKKKEDK